MKPIVAVVAQGAMGAGIARRLVEHGVEVRTSLEGRSAGSVARAREAGMREATREALCASDFFLSIVPPAAAVSTARWFAEIAQGNKEQPVFVDCNAVSPKTVRAIAAVIEAAGGAFIDASIIGGPPKPGRSGPAIYASGPEAARLEALRSCGLDIRVLGNAVGEASALKMAYAGITKGLNAIGIAMILAASASGSAEALRQELAESQPELLRWFQRSLPGVFAKAYRWVGEMQEIAAFAAANRPAAEIYAGAAALYQTLSSAESERAAKIVHAFLAERTRSHPSRAAHTA